jgi:hypothetical protein
VTGTTHQQPAWNGAQTLSIRSHGSAAKPRQCSIRRLDCDSCCRGFESHQPPQYSCGSPAGRLVIRTGRNSHRGNTRHPVKAEGGAAALMSRQTGLGVFTTGFKISLVNVRDHEDNARALAHAFRAVHSAQWSRTGNAVARAFAFLGRCFVVASPLRARSGAWVGRSGGRSSPDAERVFDSPGVHLKAPSSSGRALTSARACMGCTHETPAPATNRNSRPGVDVATGARQVRDGVTGSALAEVLRPTVALGLDSTEAGFQMEKVIPHITLPQLWKEMR